MQQKLIKVISVLLATTILYANLAPAISYAAEKVLSAKEIENQGTSTNHENVKFDVYYEGGKHSAIADINSADTKLNLAINVKKAGYLKQATVDFSDSNFAIELKEDSENISSFDKEAKKITFNQISSGKNVLESLNIIAEKKDEINADMFSKDNNVKFTATYVDAKAEEIAIEKTIVIHTEWNAQTAKAKLGYEITKYIPLATNGVNKLITQGKVTSYVEDSVLPIKETQIELVAPMIDNKYPEKVAVVANSAHATNGDLEGKEFSINNWSYEEKTGKILINVKNEVKDGKIKWAKNATDEYLVTYIYSEDVYEAVKDSVVRVTYDVKSKMSLYGNGSGVTGVNASTDGYEDQTGKIGDVVELEVATTGYINKGYMYNNINATEENKKETEYITRYTANVSYADIIDSIELQLSNDKFVTSQGEEKPTVADGKYDAYNKALKISGKEFLTVFGEEGKIDILDSDGTILETINKDKIDDNGDIVVELPTNETNIKIQTSKPVKEGKVAFEIIKALAKDIKYTENEIKNLASLKTSAVLIAKNGDIEIAKSENGNEIKLQEPSQKVGITTNNDRLSTIVKNENVEITVTLENDSIDDIMYKNPTIEIDLPTNIEQLNVKKAEIFFDDELKIKDTSVIENDDGTKTIVAKLEGTQTKYNNAVAKGATIVFTTDITLNKLTPTTETKINVTVTNGNTEKTVATSEVGIKYIAPTGVVVTNTMTGYNGDEVLEAINGERKQVIIPTKAEQKELTFKMDVINNYDNTLDNVVVLGRTPFEGNKDVATSQSLGSTITLPMTSGITVNGIDEKNVTIYYSENGEATTDLAKTSNGWKTNVTDYSKIKSYMIVLNDYTLNIGSMFTFTYKTIIPANLDYDNAVYENYAVYFNNNKKSGTIVDKAVATPIGVTTGTIAKLDAKITSKAGDGAKVPSGSNLEYEVTLNNKGTLDAENVVIEFYQPKGTSYSSEENEQYETETILAERDEEGNVIEGSEDKQLVRIKLGTIKANESLTKKLTFITLATSEEEKTVELKAKVKYGDNLEVETNTVSNILTKKYFKTQILTPEGEQYKEGEDYSYRINVKSSEKSYEMVDGEQEKTIRKNTVITVILPEELKYESIELIEYKSSTYEGEDITSTAVVTVNGNVVTINIGDVDGRLGKKLVINTKVGKLPNGVYQKDVTIKSTVQADNTEVEQIDDVIEHLNKAGISATQTSNIPEGVTISSAENFTYTFTIENLSNIDLRDVKFVDYLPQGVQLKTLEVVYSDGTIDRTVNKNDDGSIETQVHLGEKAKVTINVNVAAKSLDADTPITNKAKISHELVAEFETNEITHSIKRFEDGDININPNPGDNDGQQTKKIIGTIWVDENKDGTKDARESKVEGVQVLLLNNSTGDIALDSNGMNCITNTGKNGTYMFNNVKPGKYSVIFLYDSSNYSPTEYRKNGVSDEQNSDAIDKTVIYEGKTQVAAVTEEIIVSDENIYNIDLGIVEDPKFDLSLNKIVESITVNDTKKTTEHNYNGKIAKIDFEAKYAPSSSMVVKYKFTVKNEGGVAGYVKKLADYLPAELKFNSELNPDWYEGKDGVIYNNSLANTLINPGESKELTLILTKNMNSEDFGLINNSAEIYETSNDYGLLDVDSTPGNKVATEDDYSTADVLTTIKTGQIIVYTTLTLTVIAIIGVGIYMIKKKVLK